MYIYIPFNMIRRSRRRVPVRRSRKRPIRRYRRTVKRVPRYPTAVGIPKAMFAKLRYSHNYQASIGAGSSASHEFRMNSLYDPDKTGVGTQPYYFDQYSAMFQRYRVYGCMVEIECSTSSATFNLYAPIVQLASYTDATPSWSTVLNAGNAKRSVRKVIISGTTVARIKRYYDLRSLAGVSKIEYNTDAVYEATTSNNPTREIIANCMFLNNDGTNTVTFQAWVRLTFYCKFFEAVEPAPS